MEFISFALMMPRRPLKNSRPAMYLQAGRRCIFQIGLVERGFKPWGLGLSTDSLINRAELGDQAPHLLQGALAQGLELLQLRP